MSEDNGNVVMVDREMGVSIIDDTGLDIEHNSVWQSLVGQHPEVASLVRWSVNTQAPGAGRHGTMFERDRFVTPGSFFDQLRVAKDASETDDVVSGVVESTESLAFTRMSFLAEDQDEEDVWNQNAGDIDLDSRLREMWRELFICSQFYACVWFGNKDYKVRGDTLKGNQKRRTFTNLRMPLGISLMDPLKVIPVGPMLFNQEKLAYIGSRSEEDVLQAAALNDPGADDLARQIILEKYVPDDLERRMLGEQGVPADYLYLLNPVNVWRHTATRSQYERWASVRMKSIFSLLDLKEQLRQMDRAHLIGGPLRVDQRIATPEGWKPIGAARVGDKVFSVDGKPTEIIGVFPQGVLPMHKVTFTDGAHVFCDGTHPWTVSDRRGRSRTITVDQIVAEGLTDTNGRGGRVHRHRIPIAAPLELPEADLALDPYLVGYMIGDGSFTQSIPKITCAEPEDDQPWRDVLPLGTSVSQYETREGFCPQYGLKGARWRYNAVTDGLRDIGLWGVVDEDKFIPDEYLWASVSQRWALLQGLCDSDGHSHQAGGVEFSTVSKKLASAVVQLAQSLGGVAKISERVPVPGVHEPRFQATFVERFDGPVVRVESFSSHADMAERIEEVSKAEGLGVRMTPRDRGGERVLYRLWISLHQPEAPFRIARKVTTWRPRKVRYVRAIASVEPTFEAEAVCIKTARDDGLFLTEGMLVTHNTNFIILVKKGTDQLPAKQGEIENLQASVRTVARVPVIVGDHRLSVEIVTPKTDNTLSPERYNGLDARITARLYQMFMTGNFAAGAKNDDSIKLAKVVARGMESRRHQLRRTIERKIIKVTVDANEQLTGTPKLRFHPARIDLTFDPALVSFLIDVRDRGDISRETYLNEIDVDQDDEAILRKREKDRFDKIFVPTNVPFGGPGVAVAPGVPGAPKPGVGKPTPVTVVKDPKTEGRNKGGTRNGGGAAPGSGQGQAPRKGVPKDKPKPSAATDEQDTETDHEEDDTW